MSWLEGPYNTVGAIGFSDCFCWWCNSILWFLRCLWQWCMQALRAILDSPLNRYGLVGAIYVKIENGVLFEVKPQVRIPRTLQRFCGLMSKHLFFPYYSLFFLVLWFRFVSSTICSFFPNSMTFCSGTLFLVELHVLSWFLETLQWICWRNLAYGLKEPRKYFYVWFRNL